MQPYHAQKVKDVLSELHTSKDGLSVREVSVRLKKFGRNELKRAKKDSLLWKFVMQFNNFLIYILIAAVAIAAIAGEYVDAIVIGVILVLNAILGFVQEYKAERAIEALQKLASLKATVIRGGHQEVVDAATLVPGDIIQLEAGYKVPADARLIEEYSCSILESPLTGESIPSDKNINVLPKETGVGDRENMVFFGTTVTRGRGTAVVTSTGMHTQIGHIAGLVHSAKPGLTPLQRQLEHFGKRLGWAILVICLIVFGAGLWRGFPWLEMLIASISLAVAAVPEGLPAVVTITLAMSVRKMVKRNVLVRKLPSVETLGACSVICSDKTGTLTHDQMTVKKLYVDGSVVSVSGEGYNDTGKISEITKNVPLLLRIGSLCNSAVLEKNKGWNLIGDPTEGALLASALKGKLDRKKELGLYPKVDEIPFTSERKMMSTIHKKNGKLITFTKGAPDVLLENCTRVSEKGKVRKLTKVDMDRILKQTEDFAKNALRVLGFAYKDGSGEKELVFVGLQGMIDPPRQDAIKAVRKCEKAGIKVVMITGDHKLTAQTIAKQMGIPGKVIEGKQLAKIDLDKHVDGIGVYARVEPAQKVKIVDAFKAKGYIVAMTGDGVNDAPALKKSDIGVAMGITGTDVAKEASDMIVLDDNFTSIVAAVDRGRTVFDNIQKFVEYLLSCNLGEVLVIFIGIMIGLPLPLIAIQILWMNLVTDGFPALALGMDPPEPGIMAEAPKKKEKIVEKDGAERIGIFAALIMVGTLGIFWWSDPFNNLDYARSMAFNTLVVLELFQAIGCRSLHKSLFKVGTFKNLWLWGAIFLSLGLQAAILYTPLNNIFSVVPLTAMDWGITFGIVAVTGVLHEVVKLIRA